MRNKIIYIAPVLILTVLVILFFSFRTRTVQADEYVSWVENPENGLRTHKTINAIKYETQFMPTEYLKLKKGILDSTSIGEFDKLYQLRLRIRDLASNDILSQKVHSEEEFYSRINYLSFDFQNNLSLISNEDTVPCSFYQYVPNYSIAPFIDMIIGFKKNANKNSENDLTLIIDDVVFNSGLVKLEIKNSKLPKVNY